MGATTVRAKLTLNAALMVGILLLLAVVSLVALAKSNQRLEAYVNGVNARATLAVEAREAVNARAIAARNLVLVSGADDLAKEKAAVLQADREVGAKLAELKAQAANPELADEVRRRVGQIEAVEQ
ncbi:MAG: hypothetical protein RI907_1248, partial [Pseudomonadota bacterium]